LKTYIEKINAVETEIYKAEQLILKIQGQRAFLDCYLHMSNMPIGIEIQVKFDPATIWLEFSFLEGAIIYHAVNYIFLVKRLIEIEKIIFFDLSEDNDIRQKSIDKNIADKISYEFDSFIIKFQQALEDPTLVDISKATKGKNKDARDKFSNFKTANNRKNIDGLYWQMNLLRNPAAHSSEARYHEKNGQAYRFSSISSNAEFLEINENEISLPCRTLINLKKSPKVKAIIQEEIINKNNRTPFWNIIIPNKSPSGRNKNTPYCLSPSGFFEPFDLLGDFCELIFEAGNYIENVNQIFYGNMGEYPSEHLNGVLIYGQDANGKELTTSSAMFD